MRSRWPILMLLCLLASLLVPGIASASTAAGAETRVGAFDFAEQARVAGERSVTLELHRGCKPTYDQLASDSLLAARGAGRICFAAGTLVHTERGLVPIEEVQVGDYVWSRSEETGEEGYRRVARTFVTPHQPTLELEFVAGNDRAQTLEVTGEHPFWVKRRGWVAARSLRPGDAVYTSHGGWLRVSSGTWTGRATTVYNFEVEDFHTYFVSETGAGPGVWVHNDCIPGNPFRGKDAPAQAFKHLEKYHGLDPKTASNRLHKLKDQGGLGAADDVAIGRTGDVYNAQTGERLGTLTDNAIGRER